MFIRPPHGHRTRAVTAQRPPVAWVLRTLSLGLLASLGALVIVVLIPLPDPMRAGLTSLPGFWAISAMSSRGYACGPDWFRRGERWVKLHHLTDITVQDGRLSLLDTRQSGSLWDKWMRSGHVDIPLHVIRTSPELHTALRAGIGTALQSNNPVRINRAAAELFILDQTPGTDTTTGG